MVLKIDQNVPDFVINEIKKIEEVHDAVALSL